MIEVIIGALAESVNNGNMTIEQVPIPYQNEVSNKIQEQSNTPN